jgi:hypothetical protein
MHGGQAQATAPNARVKVNQQALWVKAALRVRAGGAPVLLQDSQALCVPNGTGVNIVATQARVKGT